MPRKKRSQILIPHRPNHIICRGNNRRKLFSYPYERHSYLRLLARALVSKDCQLHALCLMQNHVHLLLTPPSTLAGSECMKQANQCYAQRRNERRGGSGKLFEQRFESFPIEDDHHLAACTIYINGNPFRANMRNPDRFQWSTHALHCGSGAAAKVPSSIITFDTWYLSLGSTPGERAEEYRRCFDAHVKRTGPGGTSGSEGPERRPDSSSAT